MSDLEDAKQEIRRRAQTSLDPVVTEPELAGILESHLIATRESSYAYTFGQKVRPATRNGHVYQVIEGGTTASTEPTWPTEVESVLVDGTVTFQEVGVDRANAYDIRAALYEVWDLKTAKAASENQMIGDGRGQATSYLYLNCQRERDKYRSVGVA